MATAPTVPQQPPSAPERPRIDLGPDTYFTCDPLPGQLAVALVHEGDEVFNGNLVPGKALDIEVGRASIKASVKLSGEFDTGRILANGRIEALSPASGWYDVLQTNGTDKLLSYFDPCGGAMGGSPDLKPGGEPSLDPALKVGEVVLATPQILRIHVAESDRIINNVGQMVKRRLFPTDGDFIFNTVASVGCTGPTKHYPDPESPWFNLFVGYYQIDAPQSSGWQRPFGYEDDAGENSNVDFDELVRLGKADWNWFSNWNYGIPLEAIKDTDDEDTRTRWRKQPLPPEQIGNTWWHHLVIKGFLVASCYESDAPGAGKLQMNSAITPGWRFFFGGPCPRPNYPTSFMQTTLDTELYMAYHERDGVFHTCMFGGTNQRTGKAAVLQAQLGAVRQVMEKCYPDLGFAARPPDPPAVEEDFGIDVKRVGGFTRAAEVPDAMPSKGTDQPA